MQPYNLWLYATNYHLQFCFLIVTISHQFFQSITILATMVQLVCNYYVFHPSMLINYWDFHPKINLYIQLIIKIITIWLPLCDVPIPLIYTRAFCYILRLYFVICVLWLYLRFINCTSFTYYGYINNTSCIY
jgi:hypothetical protein